MDFIFEGDDVSIKIKKLKHQLCKVKEYIRENGEAYYRIEPYLRSDDEYDRYFRKSFMIFPSREQAAYFFYNFKTCMTETLKSKPLPADIMSFLSERAKNLDREKQELRSKVYSITSELNSISRIAKIYNVEHTQMYTEFHTNNLEKLLNIKVYVENEKEEMNFFSEGALYNLVGKDKARTILSLLRKVVEEIDPLRASKI